MAESSHRQQRLGARSAMGEVVEVSGGHIVRSTGRKDRHSKVCTAKGPRDRRVRLAAHTAIQFYDVQDRLGYDRPSKAVDWLIKKAQAAIDELAQLPPWHPTAALPEESDVLRPSSKRTAAAMAGGDDEEPTLRRRSIADNPNAQISSFLPLSMDSDSIADTIKSFFPLGASGESFTSSDLTPRSSSHPQDLKLSLQSQQDPLMLHHHTTDHNSQPPRVSQLLLTGTPFEYDAAAAAAATGWADHHHTPELSRFQRFASFGGGVDTSSTVSAISAFAPFYFNPPPPPPPPLLQQLFGHNHHQLVSQRGPLQSSNTPSIRAWIDPSAGAAAGADPTYHHHHSSLSGSGFASGYGGFPGFHIPARIQGDEEEHDGYSDKPSSASSDSRH